MGSLALLRGISNIVARLAMRPGSGGLPTVSVGALHMPSCLDSVCRFPIPRQQFIEPVDGVTVDHTLEHIAQVGVGLDVIHFGGFNQRTQRRPPRSTTIRFSEQMIFTTQCNGANRALNRIGVELNTTIVQEPREPMPARQ